MHIGKSVLKQQELLSTNWGHHHQMSTAATSLCTGNNVHTC